jgi:phosphatidylglycerol lysyltransferase
VGTVDSTPGRAGARRASTAPAAGAPPDPRVLRLVRQYGWNATSFQVLEPGFRHHFAGPDACVAYVDTGRAWVAAGAPLCDPAAFADAAASFVAAAHAAGRRACFFGTEERFVRSVPLRSLLVGEQAVWEPGAWDETLARTRSLREQLRRARAKRVRVRTATVTELTDPAAPAHQAVDRLVRRWLGSHELAPMGFLVQVDPFTVRDDHRLYLAELDGQVVGFLAASPIFARRGWLLQAFLRAPEAPNGTSELLVDTAMRAAAAGADELVTLGLAPLAGEVAAPLRWARSAGAVLFDFGGLRDFKAKLRPQRWDPVYLAHPPEQSAARSVADVLSAFARGRLLRFGIQTLLRGPAIVVRLLTLALLPWTAALAASDARRWFPWPALKWAWVIFDVLLACGLLLGMPGAPVRRWRDRLARAVLIAVGADAVVTAVEVAAWNLPRVARVADAVVAAVAVLAPALAFVVLWRARTRRR